MAKKTTLKKGQSVYNGVVYNTTNRDEVFRLRFEAGLVNIEPFKPTASRVRSLRAKRFRYEEIAAAASAFLGKNVSSATIKKLEAEKGDPIWIGRGTKHIGAGALGATA